MRSITMSVDAAHDAYAALRIPGFRRYLTGNVIGLLGLQMQATAVGWDVYSRTTSNYDLGLVGLIQFLPVLLFSLPAGFLADQFERKRIVQIFLGLSTLTSMALACISLTRAPLWTMYVTLFLAGVARAVQQPAKASLLPLIVPRSVFPNALTWHSTGFQLAMVGGPMLAGLIMAVTFPAWVFLLEGLATGLFVILLFWIPTAPQDRRPAANPVKELLAGMSFVWHQRIILSALSLDLFAVLLGGSVTLIPVFSSQVLNLDVELYWVRDVVAMLPTSVLSLFHVVVGGPHGGEATLDLKAVGNGLFRSAPAIGALVTSVALAHRSPMNKPGRLMLWSVVGFGVATIVFGLSRSFWLSWFMLFLTGAFDMISVVIRHSLVQLLTPDAMRGRVSAVNGLFIGASNELGGFESGSVAGLLDRPNDPKFGPTMSVVLGGIGTILVVGLIGWLHPSLRRMRREDLDAEKAVREL